MSDELRTQRVERAIRTGGTSAGPIYDAVWRKLEPLLRGEVLDYGAGNGALTALLLASPLVRHVTAADLAPQPLVAHDPKVKWIAADLNEALELPSASFDVIAAVEVIEHLENPRAVAREWRRLLRPGGSLVMSTPNVESWRSLLSLAMRGHFVAFLEPSYPAHITALTAADVHRVLAEAGFSGINIGYTGYGLVPKLRTSWQQLSIGLFTGRRYSDNLIAVAHAV